jgi:hypothetical protein
VQPDLLLVLDGVDQIGLYYLHSGRATDAPFED